MKTGITGLHYSGKTTLFCALTGQSYSALAHGKDIHVGIVKVPDARLDRLYEMFTPLKKTYAVMEYFDIAGQASVHGKGMESQVLQTLKNADSLIVVLDAFRDKAAPMADFDSVISELVFTDLVVATGRLERIEKEMRSGKSGDTLLEKSVLEKFRVLLEDGKPLRDIDLTEEEGKTIRGYQFLSLKPLFIVINIPEKALTSGNAGEYEKPFSTIKNSTCSSICAEIEMEIAGLDENDRPEFLRSAGIEEPALGKVIRLSYASLGLISFFTAGGKDEVRAWTVRKGARAPECAGVIHSDLERGFIRSEVVSFEDLMKAGSFKTAREMGLLRIEGKDYVTQDGDILTIRFSV
jgi:ribosome-binding ATPase